jgi:thiamine biosynthesis lipoprotein
MLRGQATSVKACAEFTSAFIPAALVAASGDLAFGGPPPGQRSWKIGVDSCVLELSNAAVSTSGDTELRLEVNGKRYSHIIDPVTPYGQKSHAASLW